MDRAPSHTGTIQFFRVFSVSSSKRTQNQKSDRKLERRARKIGSRDSDPISDPETENWITRPAIQNWHPNWLAHFGPWVGP